MKLLKLPKYLLFLLIGISLFSCQEDKSEEKLLHKAQSRLAMDKSDVALDLLASIQNPQNMDKYSYMQYIVTSVGAKYEVGEDMKNDTLIFEAQRYFSKKGNVLDRTLANFYAAQLYNANNLYPQALKLFMQTIHEAKESDDKILTGRSFNNIGYIYYKQELFDSAIVNYQKALSYYDKIENADQRKLKTFTNIGFAYSIKNELDSAFLYFQKGLNLAKKTDNKLEESQLNQNLGITCYYKGEYQKAIEYFQSSLDMDITSVEQIRQINLYLLNTYNKKQDIKAAKQYADFVIKNLPEVTYTYTVKEMYAALSEYYRQSGDYKQALQYSDLEKVTKEQIEKETNAPALLEADKDFYLAQKDKEAGQLYTHIFLYLSIGAILFFIVLIFVFFVWKNHKKDKEEIRLHVEKYEILRGMLHSVNRRYPNIEAEIKAMLEDNEEDEKENNRLFSN
ncbi:tetratricopeptide repeat protein [Dysgonomonas alginatilytica]|uniref:Tetratricopeptide repeat protein n=1 Tax=Dysgonomonas alginatilytica TaxID=1605892 RepID=A0A2V3PV49_9BACT|nr:tetratricopeptide repeat protein [Dysgonomonas alginatilytica]PXV68992.1 tetratricopeptide repeat protein [Dysgonomonas alginatilytica]